MSDIEESLKRITSHNGVMGVAVLDDAGKLARFVWMGGFGWCGCLVGEVRGQGGATHGETQFYFRYLYCLCGGVRRVATEVDGGAL